jgi:gephyrin
MSGYPQAQWRLPRIKAKLTQSLRLDSHRPEFHRVHVKPINEPPYFQASSTGGQRSSKASSMAVANGLVCLPIGENVSEYAEGTLVDAILLSALQ